MTYEELVKKVQEAYKDADASKVKEHLAIQFNVEGEVAGAFYLEVAEGKVKRQIRASSRTFGTKSAGAKCTD